VDGGPKRRQRVDIARCRVDDALVEILLARLMLFRAAVVVE
jgi:hypothetical protein